MNYYTLLFQCLGKLIRQSIVDFAEPLRLSEDGLWTGSSELRFSRNAYFFQESDGRGPETGSAKAQTAFGTILLPHIPGKDLGQTSSNQTSAKNYYWSIFNTLNSTPSPSHTSDFPMR